MQCSAFSFYICFVDCLCVSVYFFGALFTAHYLFIIPGNIAAAIAVPSLSFWIQKSVLGLGSFYFVRIVIYLQFLFSVQKVMNVTWCIKCRSVAQYVFTNWFSIETNSSCSHFDARTLHYNHFYPYNLLCYLSLLFPILISKVFWRLLFFFHSMKIDTNFW